MSRFEGSPNVVLEAMACRCPVIVSDIAAHRELLDDHSALFFAPDDVEGVAGGIVSSITDTVTARRRAGVAAVRAERYGSGAAAAQYLAVYRDVLSARRGAPTPGNL
jgi:glycosyltransferase involved in cell wall biosynthesis